MVPILDKNGVPALPSILPQEHVPCEWCKGVAAWDWSWAVDGTTELFRHVCPACHQATISEYREDGEIIRRRSSIKFTKDVQR